MAHYAFGSDKDLNLIQTQRRQISKIENQNFVSGAFDDIRTLHRKEISLLNDLGLAYRDKNFKEFTKLLHRTGYKPTTTSDQVASKTLLTTLGLQKFRTSRNLLFERDNDKESFFEKILQTPGSSNSEFLKLIWEECELWRNSDVLTALNPKGLQPIDYIIESQDDGNLFAFLVFDFDGESDSVSQTNKKYFLKLKNEQYKEKTGQSLFQKFYSMRDELSKQVCLSIMEKLLKEMKQIDDIKEETAIDEVLKIGDEIYKHEILKFLITYWPMQSRDYDHYKAILSDISPYFKLILTLRENHERGFEQLFQEYLDALKQKHGDHYDAIVQSECNSLLEFALNHGQRKTIDIILNLDIIDTNKVSIKSDLSLMESRNAHYFMAKLLENGYYLGNNQVPFDWISAEVLNEFLDSRVSENGFIGCQIDYNFLIDPIARDEKLKSDYDGNEKLFFLRGMQPLEKILDSDKLRILITHPVLATFINLKCWKFRKIFYLNFFIFLFLYMVPFFFFIMTIPFSRDILTKFYADYNFTLEYFDISTFALMYTCVFATTFLTFRELFEINIINDSYKDYFNKKTNLLEITIVVLSWTLLYTFKFAEYNYQVRNLPNLSAAIIILATVKLLSILPFRSMTIYMFMMKQVTYTFVRFFTIFIPVIIAFSLSFCVVLKPSWGSWMSPFENVEPAAALYVQAMEEDHSEDESVFTNFANPITSFIKTLQMLSGEYSIDPYTLDTIFKQILFLIFIMTSFVLFNLINGLAISDIAMLKEQAEFLNLRQQIRSIADSERFFCNFYQKIKGNSTTDREAWWRRLIISLKSLLVRQYPHLHKMDNLSIDFRKKTVQYEQDQKKFHILQTRSGHVKRYMLDDETLKQFNEIVAKKQSPEEGVNEKLENLQTQTKAFKLSMDAKLEAIELNNGEIKKLLLQLAAERIS